MNGGRYPKTGVFENAFIFNSASGLAGVQLNLAQKRCVNALDPCTTCLSSEQSKQGSHIGENLECAKQVRTAHRAQGGGGAGGLVMTGQNLGGVALTRGTGVVSRNVLGLAWRVGWLALPRPGGGGRGLPRHWGAGGGTAEACPV